MKYNNIIIEKEKGVEKIGLSWAGLSWAGLGWAGLGWTDLEGFGQFMS